MPDDIKTDAALLDRLRKTAGMPLTAEQRLRRRVSFIYGALPTDSSITRKQIEEILAKGEAA